MARSHSSAHREIVIAALDQYETRLVRYAARMLGGDLDQARDVVQHTFLKLCQQDLAAIQNRLLPWLFTVCRNNIFDQQKRHSSSEVTDGESIGLAARDRLDSTRRRRIGLSRRVFGAGSPRGTSGQIVAKLSK